MTPTFHDYDEHAAWRAGQSTAIRCERCGVLFPDGDQSILTKRIVCPACFKTGVVEYRTDFRTITAKDWRDTMRVMRAAKNEVLARINSNFPPEAA